MRHPLMVLVFVTIPSAALAQEPPVLTADETPSISEMLPPEELPPANPLATAASSGPTGYFPSLPPSRPCVKKDLLTRWKLEQVYENPAGGALAEYNSAPYQYLRFKPNSTYQEIKSASEPLSNTAIKQELNAQQGYLTQYVVGETGIVYFYRDGVATETMACFIVANPKDPFAVGQMLLMPPAPAEGQPVTRMVKVYGKGVTQAPRSVRPKRAKRR